MGTRADFYIGKGKDAKWIGSIAWDGYRDGIDDSILKAETETQFVDAVKAFFKTRKDVTLPEHGWPWPWEDSSTTDCSYWFFDGQVWDECDDKYIPCKDPEPEDEYDEDYLADKVSIEYPQMDYDNFSAEAGSLRSGVIVVGSI
ncbi:hypothetical protein [Endozoicomonas lisbonensis]|uniref:Uncharacterized protein n=1 Tax=Endozoicomonas lisbonensis TaxID=3120522 RepID=A0ABV2SCU2_9GAMM